MKLMILARAGLLMAGVSLEAAVPGKITYEPLSSDGGRPANTISASSERCEAVRIELDDLKLDISVPRRVQAYDLLPLEYTLEGDCGPDARVAVEAVAFEDESRRRGRDLYDLALPGDMRIKIEYLGSQTGVFRPQRVSRLTRTSRHTVFPPYELEPLVRSGRVHRGHYLFFKFRITNVGNTILDPEGFGGWMAMAQAHLISEDGSREMRGQTINLYERHLEYLYPGESFEQWVNFHTTKGATPTHARTLLPGRHVISYQALYRWNREYNWGVNIWGGKPWFGLEVPIEVVEDPSSAAQEAPVEPREVVLEPDLDRMTRYVRSLEEFMTSFCVFERDELEKARKGTLHVQVAPWTKQVVIKLIGNTPGRIRTVAVPVEVSSAGLAVQSNPDNPFVLKKRGRAEPVFLTQSMNAMRVNIQLGPHPEQHLRQRTREMLDCGVNVICSTGGNWHIAQIYNPQAFVGDIHAETFKHFYDVIVREMQLPVFGWGLFPAKTHNVSGLGSHYWNEKLQPSLLPESFSYSHGRELDVAHPDYPRAYAGAILFNHRRWGHLFYRTADGDVLIDVEDTWGWHRDDINVRYTLGPHALTRFRTWLRDKYRDIDRVNTAWGTRFTSFEEIDPQQDQGNEGHAYGLDLTRLAPVYNRRENPFHEWTPAIDDWDMFRTELRCDVYEEILRHVRQVIPKAQLNLRTEGAIIPVTVAADSDNPHLRHVYYSQRRQALVPEVLRRRQVIRYHSDYTTIPYTPAEWRQLLSALREEGIRGNYLPQFCTARDMLLNDDYGRDYQMNYNLPEPRPALMMHVLQAAFPVWKAMYEEGHCPGVLWEDYMCDGFVSETQKRELKLFRERVNAAHAAAEVRPARR
jgi:hypothetical protein